MNVVECLERMKYYVPAKPDLVTLKALMKAFLFSIPFENLDIHMGLFISLRPDIIFDKLIINRRGGICYERNILFHDLLSAFGFDVEYLSARMIRGNSVGPEFDHMVLLVGLDHDYLVDVGNGHLCREPLRVDGKREVSYNGNFYHIGPYDNELALYCRQTNTSYIAKYVFSLLPRSPEDFEDMNLFHQSSPDSLFNRRRIVTIEKDRGRISLIDRRLITSNGRHRKLRDIATNTEYLSCLKEIFDIDFIDKGWRTLQESNLRH